MGVKRGYIAPIGGRGKLRVFNEEKVVEVTNPRLLSTISKVIKLSSAFELSYWVKGYDISAYMDRRGGY